MSFFFCLDTECPRRAQSRFCAGKIKNEIEKSKAAGASGGFDAAVRPNPSGSLQGSQGVVVSGF